MFLFCSYRVRHRSMIVLDNHFSPMKKRKLHCIPIIIFFGGSNVRFYFSDTRIFPFLCPFRSIPLEGRSTSCCSSCLLQFQVDDFMLLHAWEIDGITGMRDDDYAQRPIGSGDLIYSVTAFVLVSHLR